MVNRVAKQEVLKKIRPREILKILKELIEIRGHRELPEKESKVTEYITQWFEREQMHPRNVDVVADRTNSVVVIKGTGGDSSLMYNCHLDTVPDYGWASKPGPFEAVFKENKVCGRGSCDMKGAIASVMVAMRAIKHTEIELKGDLVFAGVIGEEGEGSIGTKTLVEKGPHTDMAVVCEPTDLNVSIGHRGSCNLRLFTHGVPAHTAYPERGVNAIVMMSKVLDNIDKKLNPKLKRRKHRLLGPPTLTPAVIQGGMRTDVVPDLCETKLNYRYSKGQEPELIKSELEHAIHKLQERMPNLEAEVEILTDAPGMQTPQNHEIVRSLRKTMKSVSGRLPRIIGSGFWTDASILSNKGGIPSVLFGPGKEEVAHTVNEYVNVDQLYLAAQVYALNALEICG